MHSVALYQEAAKIIEHDGVEGFHACSRIVGPQMAFLLVIAHARRSFSLGTFPSPPEVDGKVRAFLEEHLPDMFAFLEKPHELFYTPKFDFCDSFAAFTVFYNGKLWKTREHAYQAAKFTDPEIIEKIYGAGSPYEAKKIAHDPEHAGAKRADWSDELKESIMEELITLQCNQHETFKRKLLHSDSIRLIEDSDIDSYWGRGPDWKGKNRLGATLEKVRDRFLDEERGIRQ